MKNILVVILLALMFLFSACERRIRNVDSGENHSIEKSDVGNSESNYDNTISVLGESNDNKGLGQSHSYITISVPAGVSLAECGRHVYSDLVDYEKYGLGGIKLCAEMSADRQGLYKSIFYQNMNVTFRSPDDLHLHKLPIKEKSSNIVCSLTREIINVDIGCVQSVYHTSSEQPAFRVNVLVENRTADSVVCVIPVGQMFEVQAPDVQNIVVSEDCYDVIPPRQQRTFCTKAYCASHKRESPAGYPVKLTPFVFDAPKHIYELQSKVWNYQRSDPANDKIYTLTFYAWRMGAHVGSDNHKSKYGHAFVDIPEIGAVGYGGTVTDHTNLVQYADYKVSVKIDRNALNKVHKKYWEWKNNPPEYFATRHDCTSFAMDIADAAGIYYGPRWAIQFPASFLRSLNLMQYLERVSTQLITEIRTYN